MITPHQYTIPKVPSLALREQPEAEEQTSFPGLPVFPLLPFQALRKLKITVSLRTWTLECECHTAP